MKVNRRHLSAFEISRLPDGFTETFEIQNVQFIDRAYNPFARDKILCRGKKLFWPNYPADFTFEPLLIQSILIHELCHVWQYETGRLSAVRYLIDPRNWVYSYQVREDSDFDDYPTEKQADLLQDWFLVNSGEPPARYDRNGPTPSKAWLNAIVPFIWGKR